MKKIKNPAKAATRKTLQVMAHYIQLCAANGVKPNWTLPPKEEVKSDD